MLIWFWDARTTYLQSFMFPEMARGQAIILSKSYSSVLERLNIM